jgi:hypothetical protein
MRTLTSAAHNEDGDIIARLQHENEQLRQACKIKDLAMQIIAGSDDRVRTENEQLRQKLLKSKSTLERVIQAGCAHYKAKVELLDALELADAMLSGANMNPRVVEKKVRAAIAKATGETK